jgi:hypothetical protein
MKITEKDLEKITKMKKKYKFLKGMTTNEIVDLFLSRCEHCEEICFASDLTPVPNWKGEVYRVCESCSGELLQENPSVDDRYLQYLEDRQKVEWQ